MAGPRDHVAYFNYTDYDHSAVRVTRFRLFTEWRPALRFSVVAELRTENTDDVAAPALYVRWRPRASQPLFIQAGRIPPVVGAFARRAYGKDNAVIGQPLAYQYLTLLRPDALPGTVDDLVRMRGRGWQPSFPIGATTLVPGVSMLSASRWDTGVSAQWQARWWDLAAAVTRGSPAVPVVRETNGGLMWSGRAAANLPAGVTVGVSGARGQWLADTVLALIPGGGSRPSSQSLVATDVEIGLRKWLIRAEWLQSVFDVPLSAGPTLDVRLTASSGFTEVRVRPHPRWQAGLRLERLWFSPVIGAAGPTTWDANVDRVEGTLGFRVNRHVELKGGWQQNWRTGGRIHKRGLPVVELLSWF